MSSESAKHNISGSNDFQDHAAQVRAGEELDLEKLEPFVKGLWPEGIPAV